MEKENNNTDIKSLFTKKRPEHWNMIPDLDLYMDQIIEYMKRQHPGFDVNEKLTSSMVNNYTKQGLMPRSNGKKYGREHIAWLTAICLIKQIVSVNDTKVLLDEHMKYEKTEDFYEKYIEILDREFKNMDNLLSTQDKEKKAELALELAVASYARKLACQCLINSLKEEDND